MSDLTVQVRGRTFPVRVVQKHPTTADFVADCEGETYSESTLSRLVETLERATKAAVVDADVPFVGRNGRRGRARALHATSGDVLVTWSDGSKASVRNYEVIADLTDPELAEYRSHVEALDAERRWVDEFQKAHKVDLRVEVEVALGAERPAEPERALRGPSQR